jgi:hypothetical protein
LDEIHWVSCLRENFTSSSYGEGLETGRTSEYRASPLPDKTFSGDRWLSGEKTGFGLIVERPDIRFEAMSEEHGHLDLPETGSKPHVGERLSVIPNHVCTCVNMHDRIWYHRNGVVEGSWQVQGRGKVL